MTTEQSPSPGAVAAHFEFHGPLWVPALEAIQRRDKMLLMAHPGSGTRYVLRQLGLMGLSVEPYATWAHEEVTPDCPSPDILISMKYWAGARVFNERDWICHWARHPLKIVASSTRIWEQDEAWGGWAKHQEEVEARGNLAPSSALINQLATVALFNAQVVAYTDRRYRLEDHFGGEYHDESHKPEYLTWAEAFKRSPHWATVLRAQAASFGYSTEDRDEGHGLA